MKRLFLLLQLFFSFSLFSETFTEAGLTFCVNHYEDDYTEISKELPSGEAIVCGLPSKIKNIKIPSKVSHEGKSYAVKEIFYASGVSIYKYGEELETVEIENGVEKIGWNAFFQCERLKSIYIPDTCIEINLDTGFPKTDASGIHQYCNFESITVSKNNPKYYSKDGILYEKKTSRILFVPECNKAKNKLEEDFFYEK